MPYYIEACLLRCTCLLPESLLCDLNGTFFSRTIYDHVCKIRGRFDQEKIHSLVSDKSFSISFFFGKLHGLEVVKSYFTS